jgi:hypothetical protein
MQLHRLLSIGQRRASGLSALNNPLLGQLIRRSAGPSLLITAALGALVALVSTAISRETPLHFEPVIAALSGSGRTGPFFPLNTLALLLDSARRDPLDALLMVVLLAPWPVAILTPAVAAFSGASLAARDVWNGQLDLIRLSGLRPAVRLGGYVWGTLYRLRVWIALSAGLMPALVYSLLLMWVVKIGTWIIRSGTLIRVPFQEWMIPDVGLIPLMLAFIALALGLWGLIWLGAALGVGLALWWCSARWAALGALLVMLTYLAVVTVLTVALLMSPVIPPQWWVAVLVLLFPYLLALAATRLARRWA